MLCAPTDAGVELEIQLTEFVAIAAGGSKLHLRDNCFKLRQCLGVVVLDHASDSKKLENAADAVDLFDVGEGDFGYKGAFVWIALDQALFLELTERFAYRSTTRLELGGNLDLI